MARGGFMVCVVHGANSWPNFEGVLFPSTFVRGLTAAATFIRFMDCVQVRRTRKLLMTRHSTPGSGRPLWLLVLGLSVGSGLAAQPGAAPAARARIQWITHPSVQVQVAGLSTTQLETLRSQHWSTADWQHFLRVSTAEAAGAQVPMAGSYQMTGNAVVFQPEFTMLPGIAYRAALDLGRIPGTVPARPSVS